MSGITQSAISPHSSGGSGADSKAGPADRPYQVDAMHAVDAAFERVDSTLVTAATGSGKTHIFSKLARKWVSFGGRVLILVHRDELVRQAKRKCEALGLYPDVEKGSQRASVLAKVVIASVQSMRGKRLLRWARNHFTHIIVDECHHAAAKSYGDILAHFSEAKKLGVTATASRADGKALGDTFATVAYTYDIRRAIDEKFLVPIVARRVVVESVDLRGVDVRAGDFAQDQLAEVMGDERALQGVATPLLELARERPTIAFCVDVKHAENLARVLNSLRPECARAVSGETDDDERERTLDAHARGEFQFLTNCEILVEGYDAPPTSCVANCRPTKSWARYVQAVGRGLRLLGDTYEQSVANGKRDCLILDFTGASKHALVGPADCLAGANVIADDVRDEINRLIGSAQLPIDAVIDQADEVARRRRENLKLQAIVKYHADNVDPFIGEPQLDLPGCDQRWTNNPPSQAQLEALEKDGVTISKLPPSFSKADAWNLLSRIRSRVKLGLCSYKAAKALSRAGVLNTKSLSQDRAKVLLDKLRIGGWLPRALANEPETLPGYAASTERRDVGGAA